MAGGRRGVIEGKQQGSRAVVFVVVMRGRASLWGEIGSMMREAAQ